MALITWEGFFTGQKRILWLINGQQRLGHVLILLMFLHLPGSQISEDAVILVIPENTV